MSGRLDSSQCRSAWRGRAAFTLIELLIVLLLLGTVMSVVLACFDGGFRVYARVSAFGSSEPEAYLAGEIMERDLKNAILAAELPFKGEASAMEFAAVLYGPAAPDGQLGRVRYGAAAETGVTRSAAPLDAGAAGNAAAGTAIERLLAGDYTLTLQYLDRSGGASGAGGGPGGWVDLWADGTNLPVAVRITIAGDLLAEGPVVRTVALPVAAEGVQTP